MDNSSQAGVSWFPLWLRTLITKGPRAEQGPSRLCEVVLEDFSYGGGGFQHVPFM